MIQELYFLGHKAETLISSSLLHQHSEVPVAKMQVLGNFPMYW